MNILAVDDEQLVLEHMMEVLTEVFPKDTIHGESTGNDTIEYMARIKEEGQAIHYAFLDIQIRKTNGIDLGKKIKETFPEAKIIFCTAYSEYACDSYQMNAIGYLLKPVMKEDIIRTLEAMDKDWKPLSDEDNSKEVKNIVVQTFGIFEVYVDSEPLLYEREKAREALAYLVNQRGENVTVAELAEILFEGKENDRKTMNQVYTILSCLKKSLKEAGISDIYVKKWKYISIDMSRLTCDFIELEHGNALAMNAYKGNYLECYSWGEFTNGEYYGKYISN